jgi:hypothetical protein
MIWSLLPFDKHSLRPHHPILRFAVLALLLFADPAQAAIKGCFTRTYDAAHLTKHKGQDVTFMAIQIGFAGDTEEDRNLLQLRFRGASTMWLNSFVCIERGVETRCKIIDSAHDNSLGGSFILKPKGDSVLLVPDGDINLAWEGTTEPNKLNVATNLEHKSFKLTRLGTNQCPAL